MVKKILTTLVIMTVGAIFALVILGSWYMRTYDTPEYERFGAWPLPVKKEVPVWEKKVPVEGHSIKIGLITDTHLDSKRFDRYGSDVDVYIPAKYQIILDEFVNEMNAFDPAFIVHMGDVIEGSNVPVHVGEAELGLIKEVMEKTNKPVYWTIGNHDLRSVARRQFLRTLEMEHINQVIDHGPYRFIMFDAGYHRTGTPQNPVAGDFVPGFVPRESMIWLEQQLQTDKHVYIFMHHSLVPKAFVRKNEVLNAAEVRALLTQYNVQAVFDGHIERRYYGVLDGVEYYAFPGIKKAAEFPGSYYAMTINGKESEIDMYYQEPETLVFTKESFVKEGAMVTGQTEEEIRADAQRRLQDPEQVIMELEAMTVE